MLRGHCRLHLIFFRGFIGCILFHLLSSRAPNKASRPSTSTVPVSKSMLAAPQSIIVLRIARLPGVGRQNRIPEPRACCPLDQGDADVVPVFYWPCPRRERYCRGTWAAQAVNLLGPLGVGWRSAECIVDFRNSACNFKHEAGRQVTR